MGQKTHPRGFRLGISDTWDSRWFAKQDYARLLHQDIKIREFIRERLQHAGVPRVEIERSGNKVKVNIYTARPGIVIGKKGAEIDKLKKEVQAIAKSDTFLEIHEIRRPDLDAQLVAENIAMQLQRRIMFRRAMKEAVARAMRMGAQGIRVQCAGRLGRPRDRENRVVPRRTGAAPHAACGRSLRPGRGQDDVRSHRRQVLDLSRRRECPFCTTSAGWASESEPCFNRRK